MPGSLSLLQETQFGPEEISAYNCQLVAICEATKHFRHMLEVPHFFIFTDHKPTPSSRSRINTHSSNFIV
jgi:hypothetical protein